ncbi:uncharacterized protein Tco025E_04022 [Trypanosoma conorhini]|uniref:Uncharacterized protein n=1 Tax=Trypanosoma conorhini TaxID=83891 RepID=A0A422PPH4_9TRYP|nr:uncharacterized protein Tco025E_04022 [Trypanosoma conorhini]RNF19645.1 hypothetical protein Tco025E_04022 [Trypanosoma conorhini]
MACLQDTREPRTAPRLGPVTKMARHPGPSPTTPLQKKNNNNNSPRKACSAGRVPRQTALLILSLLGAKRNRRGAAQGRSAGTCPYLRWLSSWKAERSHKDASEAAFIRGRGRPEHRKCRQACAPDVVSRYERKMLLVVAAAGGRCFFFLGAASSAGGPGQMRSISRRRKMRAGVWRRALRLGLFIGSLSGPAETRN